MKKDLYKDYLQNKFEENLEDIIEEYPDNKNDLTKIVLAEEYIKLYNIFTHDISQEIDSAKTYKKLKKFLKYYEEAVTKYEKNLALMIIFTYLSVLFNYNVKDISSLEKIIEYRDEFTTQTGRLDYKKMYEFCLKIDNPQKGGSKLCR